MKLQLFALSLSLLATSAFAADAVVEEVAVEVAPVFNWTGGYIGGQVGYGWGDSTIGFLPGPYYVVPLDPDGFIGGVYGGFNYQLSSNIVLGAEVDVQYSDISSSGVLGRYVGDTTDDPTYRYGSEQKWNASIRARAGYAFDRILPFVTAGIAFSEYEHFQNLSEPFSESANYTGWTVGGGFDYAATDNLIVRVEYRYTDFGEETFDDGPGGWADHDVDLTTNDLRLGIAYKF
jgi:outer membrane immunogenic protein